MGKLQRAQGCLSNTFFGPAVNRIEIHLLQELRGKAERWSLRNTALAPELHVIGKLLRSYRGYPRPRGTESDLKQIYFDFLDTVGILRINLSGPPCRRSTYRATFGGVLSLPGRLYRPCVPAGWAPKRHC